MGTLTTNYKLIKASNGLGSDSVDDFVDVETQLDRNLTMIDDFAYRAVNYRPANVSYTKLPTVGNNIGDKMYNRYDGSLAVWNGVTWASTLSKGPSWTDVTLNSTYENISGPANVGFIVENETAYLRGRMIRTGFAIWTNGSPGVAIAAGIMPLPLVCPVELFAGGGPIATPQFYKVAISLTGAMTITRYGSVAQNAGSTNNYIQLDGLSYGIS